MENCYEVVLGNRQVGKVQLLQQGLYYRIICRCQVPEDKVYRLFAACDHGQENLGVLVPEGDGAVLDKRIPVKRLGAGKVSFCVFSGRGSLRGEFIPISPEEPFLYITRLKTAFLESEHGKIGIRTEKHPEAV